MSFFDRVATFATMTLGIAALVGASTPGFASQLDQSLNVSPSVPVPVIPDLAAAPAETAAAPAALPAVAIDRMLIGRALTNVIENALHAMPNGGTLTVDAAVVPDQMVQLRVTDTGIGMDADAIAKIFEPYFSTKAIGTGLGLTIAKRNVEANQGTIAVTSEKGRGTSVTMTLPQA